MAMIKITNGKIVTTVSEKAFENKFRPNGWRKLRVGKVPAYAAEDDSSKNVDIDTIPISDMNGDQLKQYAKEHNIDISKTKSAAEARKVIQNTIRSQNM